MNEYERIEVSFRDQYGMNHLTTFDMGDLIRLQTCINLGYQAYADFVHFECACKRFDVQNGLIQSLIDLGWLVRC